MEIAEQKNALRDIAKQRRKDAVAAAGPDAERRFTDNLLQLASDLAVDSECVVAGYQAMSNELSVTRALTAMAEHYHATCVLPVVVARDTALIFREWQPGLKLVPGGFGTCHPPKTSPEQVPDILIIPLLAFDRRGYRLGWGGGFYDRTIGGCREQGRQIIAIGAAYDGQHIDAVAHDSHDQPVDWIVTENSVIRAVRS